MVSSSAADEVHDVGAAARNKTDRRRIAQPLLTALDVHLGPHLARGALLAVSGGPDSRSLLEAAARWPRRFDGAVHVATVDHATRTSSRGEAEAVVARARVLGLEASLLSLPVGTGADEASLRDARYRALGERAQALGLGVIVVAHHEGDVAEGALMSWLGQGGAGGAMPHERVLSSAASNVLLVRPFLDLPRAALREALGAFGVTDVVMDPETTSIRARLRAHELAALGADRGPVEEALARAAQQRRDDDDALDALAVLAVHAHHGGGDGDGVRSGPPALMRRALRRLLAEAVPGVDLRGSAPALEVVVRLMQRGTPGEVHLTGAIAIVTPDEEPGSEGGSEGGSGGALGGRRMRARIRARSRTVAAGTASTHDGFGTKLSEAHPLLTLHSSSLLAPSEDQENT